MPKNKSSLVWEYFDKPDVDTNIAKCKVCEKDLKTSGNTTNLLAHMKQKHPEVLHPQVVTKQESNIEIDHSPIAKKIKIIDSPPKFREEWLLDPICKDWIEEINEFPSKARCKYCDVTIRAKYADVKQHIRSRKHNKKGLRYVACNQNESINIADTSNDICIYNDRRDQNYSYDERVSNHNFERVSEQESRLIIRKPAPEWNATAVIDGEFKQLKLSDFRGQYVVFFFYRLDFTPVCPTEILAFNDRIEEFHELNTEVIGCSVDSHFTHLAWTNTLSINEGMGKLKIPLLSDVTHKISKAYGTYIEDQGVALRALFIIDPKGILRQITMNDHVIVRSVDETLRLIQVLQFSDKHGEVCHAGWRPGEGIIELQIIPNTEECRINIDETQKYDENLIVVEAPNSEESKFAVSSNELSVDCFC